MPRTCSGSRWIRSRWSASSVRWYSRLLPRMSVSIRKQRPENAAWDFVALGRGHDTAYWTEFLRALHEVDPEMLVNIEHEDVSLGRIEGLEVASKVLRDADAALRASLVSK